MLRFKDKLQVCEFYFIIESFQHTVFLFQVNKFDSEKTTLQQENAALTSKLVDSKVTICDLEQESVSVLCINNF